MSEYTKGPWFVNTVNRDREYPSAKVGSIDWECDCCCNCDRVSCSECEANAHLISAAPDYDEAACEFIEAWEDGGCTDELKEIYFKFVSAKAKARGRE